MNRAERVGRNEAFFREVNERVRDVNEAFSGLTGRGDFVCECGDAGCCRGDHADDGRVPRRPVGTGAVRDRRSATSCPTWRTWSRTNERFTVVRKREGTPAEVARELA